MKSHLTFRELQRSAYDMEIKYIANTSSPAPARVETRLCGPAAVWGDDGNISL